MADPYVPQGDDAVDLRRALTDDIHVDHPEWLLDGVSHCVAATLGERWYKHYAEPPEVLFHYTDAGGFSGIVESGCLWATNALYLNDRSELSYITDVIETVVEERVLAAGLTAGEYWLVRELQLLMDEPTSEVFVACFCEEPDLLSQWRGYAAGQTGYSIGFDAKTLSISNADGAGLDLRPAVYDVGRQKAWVELVVRSMGEAMRRLSEQFADETVVGFAESAAARVLGLLSQFAFSFKSEGFQEEKEWRLVLRPNPLIDVDDWRRRHVLYRETPASLVPYVPLTLKGAEAHLFEDRQQLPAAGLPIEEVTVGPSSMDVLAVEAARGFLKKHGYLAPAHMSQIPLRS